MIRGEERGQGRAGLINSRNDERKERVSVCKCLCARDSHRVRD